VAGADRRWVWAEAKIEGDRLVVWSPRVPQPVAVRYAWSSSPRDPTLYNREGLPAAPFRTDDW
jgi:sialate O-acetylesterase